MGMYTQLVLDVELRYNHDLHKILEFMMTPDDDKNYEIFDSRSEGLFTTDRWYWMLRGNSAYFSDWEEPTLQVHKNAIHFTCCFNIKNYTGEIEEFLKFLNPYIIGDYIDIGTYWYEEWEKASPLVKVVDKILRYSPDKSKVLEVMA